MKQITTITDERTHTRSLDLGQRVGKVHYARFVQFEENIKIVAILSHN